MPGEVLGASVLHTHTLSLKCLMFAAASDGNTTPDVVRLHRYTDTETEAPAEKERGMKIHQWQEFAESHS